MKVNDNKLRKIVEKQVKDRLNKFDSNILIVCAIFFVFIIFVTQNFFYGIISFITILIWTELVTIRAHFDKKLVKERVEKKLKELK